MPDKWALGFAVSLSLVRALLGSPAQPIPSIYAIRLPSATSYDTRSPGRDTIYASLTLFVNGDAKGTAIWDGNGWDGSRAEGREWVTGLHLFGTATVSSVEVSTPRIQDSDILQIVFQVLNSASPPSAADHASAAGRIRQSACAGGDGASAWDCLVPQAASIFAGWTLTGCDGVVAAERLVYTGMQLRRKTEAGDTATVSNIYRGAGAPAGCGQSIYGAVVTIARQ